MSGGGAARLRHALAERGADFYPTSREAVVSLLAIERDYLPAAIWEPACGDGAIVLPFRSAGKRVVAHDLYDWGCPRARAGIDFLGAASAPACIAAVVTNPPYMHAEAFVRKALELVPYCAMLLRLNFLESIGRMDWLRQSRCVRVHVSSRRLPMMHRHGWNGPKASSSTAYAWFVWDRAAAPQPGPGLCWFDWQEFA